MILLLLKIAQALSLGQPQKSFYEQNDIQIPAFLSNIYLKKILTIF